MAFDELEYCMHWMEKIMKTMTIVTLMEYDSEDETGSDETDSDI